MLTALKKIIGSILQLAAKCFLKKIKGPPNKHGGKKQMLLRYGFVWRVVWHQKMIIPSYKMIYSAHARIQFL